MPSAYSNKYNENALIKCSKCDCLILSDSSNSKNDKCVRLDTSNLASKNQTQPTRNKNSQLSEVDDTSNEAIVLKANRTNSLQIVVNAQIDGCCSCNDASSNEKTTSSESDNSAVKTDVKMKRICFRFCNKKKKGKDAGTDPSKSKIQDQKSPSSAAISETKEPNEEPETEPNINEFIHKFCNCKGGGGGCGGGCNTNTIIFPRDKICGDNLTSLENCIKAESRIHTRNLEEILNELYKQRREIRELRELLDLIVRTMREQLCTTAIQNNKKAYQEVLDEFCRKTCLERKSNSLSISKSDNKEAPEVTEIPPEEPLNPPTKPKKKGLFSWCK